MRAMIERRMLFHFLLRAGRGLSKTIENNILREAGVGAKISDTTPGPCARGTSTLSPVAIDITSLSSSRTLGITLFLYGCPGLLLESKEYGDQRRIINVMKALSAPRRMRASVMTFVGIQRWPIICCSMRVVLLCPHVCG